MLLLLEMQFQRVLEDESFGLPYWDWAADGDLPVAEQLSSPLWGAECMGGQGIPVSDGPFAISASDASSFRIRVRANVNGELVTSDRGLQRAFARGLPSLPRTTHVSDALAHPTFDTRPWTVASVGFRNQLEGWVPQDEAPGLHNRVHVWIGGDMLPSSSPNDPAFYLNHCNVDRVWQAWLTRHGQAYLPAQSESDALRGHRIDDAMHAFLSQSTTPREMLDVDEFYTYDALPA
jgi:tyrosinase